MKYSILLLVGLVTVLTGTALADQVVLTPSKDNTLYEHVTGARSNALGPGMFAGNVRRGSLRRALMAFDIAGNVPAGMLITGVTLTLRTTRARFTTARDMTLHRVTADWGEGGSNAGSANDGDGASATVGDATWLHTSFPTSTWTMPGGDFAATASATTSVTGPGIDFVWGSTPGLIADVQDWLDNAATNFGWLLKGDETVMETSKRFGTREHSTSTSRPRLTIDFDLTTPTVSTAWGAIKGLYR